MTKCDWCGKSPVSQVRRWELCYNCLERLEDAAPQLLEALEQCVKMLRTWRAHLEVRDPTLETPDVIRTIKDARAAIEAVTGKGDKGGLSGQYQK